METQATIVISAIIGITISLGIYGVGKFFSCQTQSSWETQISQTITPPTLKYLHKRNDGCGTGVCMGMSVVAALVTLYVVSMQTAVLMVR